MAENLPRNHEALGLIPSTRWKERRKEGKREGGKKETKKKEEKKKEKSSLNTKTCIFRQCSVICKVMKSELEL